ncbi:hypothetical protein GF385_04175, partial [Candidatus Dependentiae bacterium]|nr:hypothetical protein [Candidatus Dependentiae bacterium]
MKNLFIFVFISIFFNIKGYQPPEYGLFFEKSPRIAQNVVFSKAINLNKEKLKNGKDSEVFLVKNLNEFLHLAATSKIPLIIN